MTTKPWSLLARAAAVFCTLTVVAGAADVAWTNPSAGTWTDVANWSSAPVLPGAADDVTIDNGANNNIAVTLNLPAPDIGSIDLFENLNISGGTLHVVGETTLRAGAQVNVSGAGGMFSGGGAANLLAGNLSAQSGATISLPATNVVSHTDPAYTRAATVSASGEGSSIDLSGTTDITGSGLRNAFFNFQASGGGSLDLAGLETIAGGAVLIEASGAASQIALNSLASANQVNFRAVQGATMNVPISAIVNDVAEANRTMELLSDGAGGSLTLPNATEITGSAERNSFLDLRAAAGGMLDAPQVAAINSGLVRVTADHGEVQLPQLAEILAGRTSFEAIGDDATLNTPLLASADSASFYARQGAQVSAPLITSYSHITDELNSATTILAHGSGGLVDLSGVTQLTGNIARNSQVLVQALKRGRVDLSAATEISAGGFAFLADDGEIDLGELTTIADGAVVIEAVGTAGEILAPNLQSVHETDVIARSGADIALPSLAEYLRNGELINSAVQIRAEGYGSSIAMPQLGAIDSSTQRNSQTAIEAISRGEVVFDSLESLRTGSFSLLADQGTIRAPMLTNIGEGDDLLGATTLESRGNLSSIEAPNLASVRRTSLIASGGGALSLPALTSFAHDTETLNQPASLTATGAGSRLTLANLPAIESNVARNSQLRIEASAGGSVDLPAVTEFTGGVVEVVATGAASSVDLSHLATIAPGGTRFEARGAASDLALDALATARNTGFEAYDGATIDLPALVEYSHETATTNASVRWVSDGVGSVIAAPQLGSLTGNLARNSQLEFTATNGGMLDLAAATEITEGFLQLRAEGVGSEIDFSSLETASNTSTGNNDFSTAEVHRGGVLRLRDVETTFQHLQISVSSGGQVIGGLLRLTGRSMLTLDGELDASLINEGRTRVGGAGVGTSTINGDFTQTATGTLTFQVGGDEAGASFDSLNVAGALQLDGVVTTELVRDFAPQLGEAFEIVSAASIAGDFVGDAVIVGDVMLAPGVVGNSIVLLAAVPGDADLNGMVNLSDFNALKSGFGSANLGFAAGDFNGDGNTNLSDFNFLKENFGNSGPALADYGAMATALGTTQVPEPGGWLLLVVATAATLAMRTWRRQRLADVC